MQGDDALSSSIPLEHIPAPAAAAAAAAVVTRATKTFAFFIYLFILVNYLMYVCLVGCLFQLGCLFS